MRAECLPDYGSGVKGWRSVLVVQANHFGEDWVSIEGSTFFSWLVGVAWKALQRLEEEETLCQADSLLDDAPGALPQDYDSDDHLIIDLPEAVLAKVAQTWRTFSELFVRDLLPFVF